MNLFGVVWWDDVLNPVIAGPNCTSDIIHLLHSSVFFFSLLMPDTIQLSQLLICILSLMFSVFFYCSSFDWVVFYFIDYSPFKLG